MLWNLVQSREDKDEQAGMMGRIMRKGELVPQDIVIDLVTKAIKEDKTNAKGFFITGFPRDVIQSQGFEDKVRFWQG